jgi:hypothetical protein
MSRIIKSKIDSLEDNHDFEDGDDYYDEDGNSSTGGLYNVGGNLITERWADYADMLRDQARDGGF